MRITLLLPMLFAGICRATVPTLEPPPGWSDVKAQGKAADAVIALKGPETSSFIVKRAQAPMDNPAGVRGFLNDILTGMREASRRDYRTTGRVEVRPFRNGVTAHMIRAQLKGEERVIVALFSTGGQSYAAVLMSAAPEAMVPSLLGAMQVGKVEGAVQTSGVVRSADGQLELSLGGGLRARAPLDAEAAKGFVLVIQGSGSEIIFQKLAEADATKPGEQAAIVRELAAASAGVGGSDATPVAAAPTAAGPVGVFSWAASASGEKYSAGYLPWGYWGYQLYGRGPAADELLFGAMAALKPGPSAVPGLLASTPKIPIKSGMPARKLILGALAAALAVASGLLITWSMKRKNAILPS